MVSLLEGYSESEGAMMPSGCSPEFPLTPTASGVVVIEDVCPDFFGINVVPHSTTIAETRGTLESKAYLRVNLLIILSSKSLKSGRPFDLNTSGATAEELSTYFFSLRLYLNSFWMILLDDPSISAVDTGRSGFQTAGAQAGRLITSRHQTEISADVARSPEASGVIDCP